MVQNAPPLLLNIGCGRSEKQDGWTGVDAYGDPDILHDLNVLPWPFDDNSVDKIFARHVFEHLENWWGAFSECGRILKPKGELEIRVPDESSASAITYRDHCNVFGLQSFYGTYSQRRPGTNAWAAEQPLVPLKLTGYAQVPFKKFEWMAKYCPWLLKFCAMHLRNFIWEQRFMFEKVPQMQGAPNVVL